MWDRWAIIGVAVLVAAHAGWWGWRLSRHKEWLAAAGAAILVVMSLGIPLLLAALGPRVGR